MSGHDGLFIVIEGADGSGKGTQFNLLADRLRGLGHDVEVFDFPRYDQPSSHFVKAYLNGEYGSAKSISPYTASLFYALDRYEAAPHIRAALKSGKIVLSNRYVGSNMAHQGSKFDDEAQQRGFFLWEDGLEYQLLGIPRPTLNIYLRVPAEISYKLIAQKSERSYTKKVHDEHEADISHLRKSVRTYDLLTQLFPKDFVAIDCVRKGELLVIEEVSELIWAHVEPMLSTASVIEPIRRSPKNTENAPGLLPDKLSAVKTSGHGNIKINLKNVSLLAATSLATDCQYSVKSQDFENGFDYHLPENVSDETATLYTDVMEKLKKNYAKMKSSLDAYIANHPGRAVLGQTALLPVIPLSAYCDLSFTASENEVRHLISILSANPLPEVRQLATTIENLAIDQGLKLAGEIQPQSHQDPEILGATIAKLAQDRLPQSLSAASEEAKLLQASPRNEFDLIVAGLDPPANLSPGKMITKTDAWSYQQKRDALDNLLKKKGDRILDNVTYRFDATYDRITLDALNANKYISNRQLLPPTPRYGYGVPSIIEESGLEDLYHDCFDESLSLFSHLQAAGREEFGGYGILMGYKLRCQFTIRAGKLSRAEVDDEMLWKVLRQLKEKISEVHPLIAEHFEIRLKRVSGPSRRRRTPKNPRPRSTKRNTKRGQRS